MYLYFPVFVVKRELGGGRFELKWQELLDLTTSLRKPCNYDDKDDDVDQNEGDVEEEVVTVRFKFRKRKWLRF